MEEHTVNNQAQQPNIPAPQEPKHQTFLTSKLFLITLAIVVLFTIIYAGIYLYLGSQLDQISKSSPTPLPTETPVRDDPTANWTTYTDSDNKFSLKYPANLIVVGGAFYKKDDFERAKPAGPTADGFLEDYLARITVTTYAGRFEAYSNTLENSIVKGYSDTIIKKYSIDGYKAIEYGYDQKKKEEDIKEQEEALRSGASVMLMYFEKGLMVNREGTIIEISTLSYSGGFKNTFDQILSTFKFILASPTGGDQGQVVCTQDAKLCPDGSYVSRQGPDCEFAACPQK